MSRHGTALDTLRWGDAQNATIVNPSLAAVTQVQTKQLAQARWRYPLLWGLRISIEPQMAEGETLTFTVTYQVILGAGQTSANVYFPYTLAPTGGIYLPITDFQQVPAQDVQVICSVSSPGGSGLTDNIRVGAFLAPLTEPHAGAELVEMLSGDSPGMRWMDGNPHPPSHQNPDTGIAFPVNPDPLHYQRR